MSEANKRREWWLRINVTSLPCIFDKPLFRKFKKGETVHVREVLVGDEKKRLFSWDEIEDAIEACSTRGYGGDHLNKYALEDRLFPEVKELPPEEADMEEDNGCKHLPGMKSSSCSICGSPAPEVKEPPK